MQLRRAELGQWRQALRGGGGKWGGARREEGGGIGVGVGRGRCLVKGIGGWVCAWGDEGVQRERERAEGACMREAAGGEANGRGEAREK